ncbi:MAG TPA: (2Fe-2S)-binding protein, partial [Jatrophihabitans sp.]|nr:(2Fe-2S)-binding protein [Jatrophihabitans sp.]
HDLSGAFALSCGTGGVPALPGTAIVDTVEFFAARYRVPPRSLWGNVGSAANGAAAQLARQRPELRRHAWAVAAELLADRRVDGGRSVAGPGYRRRSCCLAFRVSGRAAACQDCVLGSAACLSR